MKLDINVFNASFTCVKFDSKHNHRSNYICFEDYYYSPSIDDRVLMWYDEQAKMLITGHTYYRDNENFESYIKVYNVIEKEDEYNYRVESGQSEKEIWSADNVVLTKTMFKDEIKKYLKSEYDKMNRLMQLLEI